MPRHSEKLPSFLTVIDGGGDDFEPPPPANVIPPPPIRTAVSELRLKHPLLPSYVDAYAWGQGDAFEIPAPPRAPLDLIAVSPDERETVRPGRTCA